MARVTTRKAHEQIRNLEPFTSHGSLRGDWEGGIYIVTSYRTAIAHINPSEGTALLNAQKYSVTTSRHQSTTRLGVHYLGESMPLEVTELKTEREFAEWL